MCFQGLGCIVASVGVDTDRACLQPEGGIISHAYSSPLCLLNAGSIHCQGPVDTVALTGSTIYRLIVLSGTTQTDSQTTGLQL